MSKIIGPIKDVALFECAMLLKQALADPISKRWKRRARAAVKDATYAIMSDAIPGELLRPRR